MGREDIEQEQPFAVAVATKDSPVMSPPGATVVTVPPGASNTTAFAVPAGDSGDLPMWRQEKLGAKCCGCCCDYRRAVIVIAVITICICLGYIIVVFTAASVPTAGTTITDDQVQKLYDHTLKVQAILYIVSLFCSICALVGAIKYSILPVALNAVWYLGNFIANTIITINSMNEINAIKSTNIHISIVPNIIVGAIVAALFMYPHIGFIYEVKVGIMSYKTYPREEYSCCCAPRARRG